MAAIGTIRNKMGGILIVVIVIAIVSFLFMDISGSGGQGPAPGANVVANVNGDAISLIEFNERLDLNITNYQNQQQLGSITDAERNFLRQNTYDEIVVEKINAAKYKELGIAVSPMEVAALLNPGEMQNEEVKKSFSDENGIFDQETFNRYISELNIDDPGTEAGTKRKSWANFERYMINQRLGSKYNSLIDKGLTIPNWMAEAQYKEDNSSVSFEYVYAPYQSIPNADFTVSDAEISQYISANAAEYKRDPSVDLRFISYPIAPSTEDFKESSDWINEKLSVWESEYSDKDSSFVSVFSDTKYSNNYFRSNEIINASADNMFTSEIGTILGPFKEGNSFNAYKILDRKMIPDSVKARHILFSYETMQSQEDLVSAENLRDSLITLIKDGSEEFVNLAPVYSNDEANKYDGGDLGNVMPNQMVVPFNNAIFFEMEEGDVQAVNTRFGLHIVQVYSSNPTSEAVKYASLSREVYPSDVTQRNIYSEASLFSGTNRTKETFDVATSEMLVNEAASITKERFDVPKIEGNSRDLIKWAFKSDVGEVSPPFAIGDNYVIAVVDDKNEGGLASASSVRNLVEGLIIQDKKAAQLATKMQGSDLASIATASGTTVSSASSLSMSNPTIPGAGREAEVVGTALGLETNSVSAPIKGKSGVFVVKPTSKVEAPAATDLSSYKASLKTKLASSITSKLRNAEKDAAEIEDNRFDLF